MSKNKLVKWLEDKVNQNPRDYRLVKDGTRVECVYDLGANTYVRIYDLDGNLLSDTAPWQTGVAHAR